MRLRLNPVIRVSDRVAVYSQIDVLDNAVLGGNPQFEPFYDVGGKNVGAPILSSAVASQPITVKRAWAEINTPIGQLTAFGRMPFHFGEGMVYNDGNCIDCDFGTTFDGGRFTVGPFLGHFITLGGDYLTEGTTTTGATTATGGTQLTPYGVDIPYGQASAAYRFSLQLTRVVPPQELKHRLDNGEWVFQYGALGAATACRRSSPWTRQRARPLRPPPPRSAATSGRPTRISRCSTSTSASRSKAFFGGAIQDNIGSSGFATAGQQINFLQGAGMLDAQYAFLKQDALLIRVLLGVASGDTAPTAWAPAPDRARAPIRPAMFRPPRRATSTDRSTASSICHDSNVTNFRLNPDFRIDQLMWRYLFTDVTDAFYARVEGRYKIGGRPSGGGDEEGFEFAAAAVYSQAIYAQSTPSGTQSPLGVEFDASISYTSHEHFFASVVAGILVPLAGMHGSRVRRGPASASSIAAWSASPSDIAEASCVRIAMGRTVWASRHFSARSSASPRLTCGRPTPWRQSRRPSATMRRRTNARATTSSAIRPTACEI